MAKFPRGRSASVAKLNAPAGGCARLWFRSGAFRLI